MKYDITYSCGHKGIVDLGGKTKERERAIYGYEHYGLCPECQAKKREEESKKNSEMAIELELPKLEGSEKQIAWANDIRIKYLKNHSQEVDFIKKVKDDERFKDAIKKLVEMYKNDECIKSEDDRFVTLTYMSLTEASAKWIIENRVELR